MPHSRSATYGRTLTSATLQRSSAATTRGEAPSSIILAAQTLTIGTKQLGGTRGTGEINNSLSAEHRRRLTDPAAQPGAQMTSVTMLCKAYPPVTGGVETFSEQIARAYLRQGLRVTVITQTYGCSGWQSRIYPEGRVSLFNTGPGGQLVTGLMMLRVAYRLSRARSESFYHATTWRPAISLIAISRRVPIIVSVHGREILTVPRLLRPLMYLVFRRSSLVAAVSSATLSRARSAHGHAINFGRWIVAANGLSYPAAEIRSIPAARSEQPVRLLTLARLVERKNVQGCIRALQTLAESKQRRFEYRIAGDGPLAQSLRTQAANAQFTNRVRFLGYVEPEQVPTLYRWADVFLHPQIDVDDGNDFEGFGLAIADAMSFGCLAIAGKGSGPDDFIEDGVTGVLVDGSDQTQLQKSLESVLQNFDSYAPIAASGQLYVQAELSWDKHVGKILTALDAAWRQPSQDSGAPPKDLGTD